MSSVPSGVVGGGSGRGKERLRVAVVQFDPKFKKVKDNIGTATRICNQLQPYSVDLVCLPEMAFTGYMFPDADSILPYLEDPPSTTSPGGPTSRFCSSLAKRLHCHVVAGYPEKLGLDEIQTSEETTKVRIPETSTEEGRSETVTKREVGANSAVMFGPDGRCLGNYRKTNLFETDMTWAKAGTGFTTFHLPPPLNIVSLGICMDLNVQPPNHWSLEDGPYEIADYCIQQKSDVLILMNAWLQSSRQQEDEDEDWGTLNYWASRLRPLWVENEKEGGDDLQKGEEKKGKKCVAVVCNRSGHENG